MWGYLNLNLNGDAREIFENVQDLQGFEAWRRIIKGIRSRSEVRRIELTPKVQRPDQAANAAGVAIALEKWNTNTRQFIEAGGRPLSYDEKKIALIGMLPDDVRREPRDLTFHISGLSESRYDTPREEQEKAWDDLITAVQRCTSYSSKA